jgi:hypothetical protein
MKPIFSIFLLLAFLSFSPFCLLQAQNGKAPSLSAPWPLLLNGLDSLKLKAKIWQNSAAQERAKAVNYARQTQSWLIKTQENGNCIAIQKIGPDSLLEYYVTHNAQAARLLGAAQLWQGGRLGENIQGQDLLLGLWDAGAVLASHQELQGRTLQKDGATPPAHHATHVAATLVGAGVNPNARGIAPQATLHAYDWNADLAEMANAAGEGLLLSCHPYGKLTGWHLQEGVWYWMGNPEISPEKDYRFGFYDAEAAQIDAIAHQAPYYLMVYSAGNDRADKGPEPGQTHFVRDRSGNWRKSPNPRNPDGPYDALNPMATAKNILTVAAVEQNYPSAQYTPAPFSSFGPTDDGRIKPDLASIGVEVFSANAKSFNTYDAFTGTSMASAGAAASLGLLQQYYAQQNAGQVMLSSTLKALAIHTAKDIGAEGPDYQLGWGLLDAEAAALAIRQKGLITQILEIDLEQGSTFSLNLLAAGNGVPLTATIAWTDPEGTPAPPSLNPTRNMLVNDLDLVLEQGNQRFFPYILNPSVPTAPASRGNNSRDNVEKIRIANANGTYTLRISHKGILRGNRQKVSIIITGLAPGESCANAPLAGVINAPLQAQLNTPVNFALVDNSEGAIMWEISEDGLSWGPFATPAGAAAFQTRFLQPDTLYFRAINARPGCPLAYSPSHKIIIGAPAAVFLPDSLGGKTFCVGAALSLPFSVIGNYNLDNQFRLEISNAAGSFVSPFTVGTLNSAGSGVLNATLPAFLQPGRNYRIRISSTSPSTQSGELNIQLARCCSGLTTLNAPSGQLGQGSDQAPYGNNLDCAWHIAPPSAQAIRLQFESFSLEPLQDYVRVYDGPTTASPLLGAFSGYDLPAELVSSGGEMLVTFSSNASITGNGFQARYQAQNYGLQIINFNASLLCWDQTYEVPFRASGPAGAGNIFYLELSDSAGRFANPMVLAQLPSASGGGSFSFTLPSALAAGAFYRLRVRSSEPPALSPVSGFITIRDCSQPCLGGAVLTAPSGVFTDGNTGGSYDNNLDCSWLIEPPGAAAIQLRFERMQTESCCDFVTVYDGNSIEAPVLKRLSGAGDDEPINSSGGAMLVRFTTDGSLGGAGWQARYQTLPRTLRFLFPSSPPRLCIDSLQTVNFLAVGDFQAGNVFSLELSAEDGSFNQPRLLATLSGNQSGAFQFRLPPGLREGRNYRLRILASEPAFISVPSPPITLTSCAAYCNGTQVFSAPSGSFEDGSGPLPYGNQSLCRFLIAPQNNPAGILLNIVNLETEPNQDFLRVYDGDNENAPLIAALSGTITNYTITASGGKALLVFSSNDFGTRQGFSVEYQSLSSNLLIESLPSEVCLGDTFWLRFRAIGAFSPSNTFRVWLSDRTGSFANPREVGKLENASTAALIPISVTGVAAGDNYRLRVTSSDPPLTGAISAETLRLRDCPSCEGQVLLTARQDTFADRRRRSANYSNNLDCSWLIRPLGGANFIRLRFLSFETEACCDRVTVYNGETASAPMLGEFRGNTLPPEVVGDAGAMLLTFRSDGSVNGAGWVAAYQAQNEGFRLLGWDTPNLVCGQEQTFTYEAVGDFPPGAEFRLEMSEESGNWQNARVLHSVPAHTGARSLTFRWPTDIEDGATYWLRMVTSAPPIVSSLVVEVTLACPTCQGQTLLTAPSGVFTDGSREDQNYGNNLSCSWLIEPQGGGGLLKLSFNRFATEACCDKVNIYAGRDENGQWLGAFGGNTIPPTVITDSSAIFLTFESDASVTGKGWEASYEQIDQYIWVITNLTNNRFCPGDTFSLEYRLIGDFSAQNQIMAELSDAAGFFSAPIVIARVQSAASGTMLCQLPQDLPLGDNYRVRLRATEPATVGGMSASFEISRNCPTCRGLRIYTEPSGIIEDGSGNGNYGNNLNCSWLIAPPGASEVTLTFQNFYTESCCDELKVYDGSSAQSPPLGTFRGRTLPPPLVAASGKMFLVFTSDGSVNESGWQATWSSSSANLRLTPLAGNVFCPRDTFRVAFEVQTPLASDNLFYIELSEANGGFGRPTPIGSLAASGSGSILCVIPANLPPSDNYRLRLASSSPAGYSRAIGPLTLRADCPACRGRSVYTALKDTISDGSGAQNYGNNSRCEFLIAAPGAASITLNFLELDTEPCCDLLSIYEGGSVNSPLWAEVSGSNLPGAITIEKDSVLLLFRTNASITRQGWKLWYEVRYNSRFSAAPLAKREYCQEDSLELGFTASGFGAANTFILELSEENGSFLGARVIGGPVRQSPLRAVIPAGQPPSGAYRLRVISAIPPDTFLVINPSPLRVSRKPSAPALEFNVPLCVGDTLKRLARGEGTAFLWQGPGGRSFSGNPWVTPNIRLSEAGLYSCRAVLGACTSDAAIQTIRIDTFSLPLPLINNRQDTLAVPSIYPAYQWRLEGNVIEGANTYFYKAQKAGNYTVTVQDSQGCRYTTQPFAFIPSAWETVLDEGGVFIYPNPARDTARLRFSRNLSGAFTVTLLSPQGKSLASWKPELSQGNEIELLLPQGLAPGFYFLSLESSAYNKKRFFRLLLGE